MLLSNKTRIPYYYGVFLLPNLFAFFILFLISLEVYFGISKVFFHGLLAFSFLLVGTSMRVKYIFDYDATGEVLSIENRGIFPIINKNIKNEFPKYKLISYEINAKVLVKTLRLHLTSKNNRNVMLKYNISYLTRKELQRLEYSLEEIVNQNQRILLHQ